MPRYLIEVPHENKKDACSQAVQAFMQTGSHFVTNADWGCSDGEHKAWIIVELGSKDEALSILPPLFRESANVVALSRFSVADIDQTMEQHAD